MDADACLIGRWIGRMDVLVVVDDKGDKGPSVDY